jgi:hypothetical protein
MGTEFDRHIAQAIGLLNKQISSLEKLGTRDGCLVQSPTSNGKSFQWHWAIGKKRVYVKQALKPTYAAEVERGRRVKELRSKVEALRSVL